LIHSTNLGYPRIGPRRELKKALEAHWAGELDAGALARAAAEIESANLRAQAQAGIATVPAADFSLYDHVLDAACLVGAVPERFGRPAGAPVDLETYFAMARGVQTAGRDAPAMEMTKWFDTNYHYLVPEFTRGQRFAPAWDRPLQALAAAQAAGVASRVVLVGPVSLLLLGKAKSDGLVPLREHLDAVVEVYAEVLRRLDAAGATWVQLDEPCFVQDRDAAELAALSRAYARLAQAKGSLRLAVATYFGHVGQALGTLAALPVDALALDFVHGEAGNLAALERHPWPADKTLIAGVVNGRNVWISDLRARLDLLRGLVDRTGPDRLQVSASCSLLHVPLDVRPEREIDPEVRPWLAFARQKLDEVVTLVRALNEGEGAVAAELASNAESLARRARSDRLHQPDVAGRLAALTAADFQRPTGVAERRAAQAQRLGLPEFPTTTIGSYPQTPEVRRLRGRWRRGELSDAAYEAELEAEIRRTIGVQEELGLDVLVHGEFERNDMVEYFGEQLEGFLFTHNGWVQSYGSRCVKPPILFGTVRRRQPMTVRWSRFAQSCTRRPVKGMLTGPVTILQWSFVRDDQPRSETCREVALAIRDEVADLEAAGIGVIQVDEPALREGLPLRVSEWAAYLDWATAAFRLSTAVAAEATQIHTHMCYGEFGDIIDAISALDADVISIENARSGAELLKVFRDHGYDKGIGPGVYDIHSPRVPSVEEMAGLLRAALAVLSERQLWVNPDCGLKTRAWPETLASLRNMVAAAAEVRAEAGV
jgi:5-methyltetrahydropteroyltriglutamate--homocysteine methyltransferase